MMSAAPQSCKPTLEHRRHLGELEPEHLGREQSRIYARRRRPEGHQVGPASARRRKPTSDGFSGGGFRCQVAPGMAGSAGFCLSLCRGRKPLPRPEEKSARANFSLAIPRRSR